MTDLLAYKLKHSEHPFTLLPVGLQCRFAEKTLKVRVLPDPIHANAFTSALTIFERQSGTAYWQHLYQRKGGTAEDVTSARKWLANAVGAYRSVYVADLTRPVNWGDFLKDPEFPEPGREGKDIDGAPPVMAGLLPDFWVYRLYDRAMNVIHEDRAPHDIAADIAMAPTLGSVPSDDKDEAPDQVMQFLREQRLDWMANFDKAVLYGMAFEIPIGDIAPPFGALMVCGLRSDDPIPAADALDAQFRGHAFTQGFDLVPQGTPTNNTDLGRSGYAETPDDIDALFATAEQTRPQEALIRAALLKQDPGLMLKMPAADTASLALGMTFGNQLDKTSHAEMPEALGGSVMNALIGPGLAHFFTNTIFTHLGGYAGLKDAYARIDQHHVNWVRGAGPLPTLRIGAQPYGMLPTVTTLDPYHKRDADLVAALKALFPEWKDAMPLPTLDPDATDGRPAVDPAQSVEVLSEVLGAVPHPTNLNLRVLKRVVEEDYKRLQELFDGLATFAQELYSVWPILDIPALDAVVEAISNRGASILEKAVSIDFQINEISALTADIETHARPVSGYHADDLQEKIQEIRDLLDVYQEATNAIPDMFIPFTERGPLRSDPPLQNNDRLLNFVGSIYEDNLLEVGKLIGSSAELHDLVSAAIERLEKPEDREKRERLFDDEAPLLHFLIEQSYLLVEDGKTGALRLALIALRERIEKLGEEHWPDLSAELELRLREALGLFMHRLDAWVTSFATREMAERRSKVERGTVLGGYGWLLDLHPSRAPVSDGFIHTSSMNHAKTAALLRSGWKGYGTSSEAHPLSVDLGSKRVRAAHWILDAVRNGQDIAQLLGARLERSLRDNAPRLDEFIDDIRAIANADNGRADPKSVIADGWRVARAYSENASPEEMNLRIEFDALFGPGSTVGNQNRRNAARRKCQALANDLDSVADVLMAQSVHSMAQGNSAETASVLNFGGDTQGPVPEITVTSTERTSRQISHRLLALLPDTAASGTDAFTAATPGLADLLSRRLPPTTEIELRFRVIVDGRQIRTGYTAIDKSGLSQMEALCLAGRGTSQATSPLGRVMRAVLETRLSSGQTLEIDTERAQGGRVSLDEFGILASAAREGVEALRPLRAADLASPESTETPADIQDEADLDARLAAMRTLLDTLQAGLESETDLVTSAIRLAALQLPGALSVVETGDTTAIETALSALVARREILDDPALGKTERLAEAIGKQLPVAPVLIGLPSAEAATCADRLDAEVAQNAPGWWRQVRHITPAADALGTFLDLTYGATDAPIRSAQLPDLTEPWLATGAPGPTRGGRLVLTAVTTGERLGQSRVSGLVLDSWTEDIPAPDQQTGVAFHYDSPTARAPQCILLPVLNEKTDHLQKTLFSHLESVVAQMKWRAVGPDRQVTTGHYLPMCYLPEHTKITEADP